MAGEITNFAVPYETIRLDLAAGEIRQVPGRIGFFQIVDTTDTTGLGLSVSFTGSSFFKFPRGLYVQDFLADCVWVQNTTAGAVTVTIGKGSGQLRDSRFLIDSTSLLPVTQGSTPWKVAGESGAGDPVDVEGKDAHAAAVTKNPLLLGAEARSTERAVVATTQLARLVTDLVGKLITLPYANPENFLSGKTAAMTAVASTAIIAAQGAGVRIYVTTLVIVCDHATQGTEVLILDGAAELLRVYVPALNGTAGPNTVTVTLPVPLRLTANTALNAQNVTTGSNVFAAAVGFKGV